MRLRVREWRERRGLSRAEVARQLGLHPRTLGRYEGGGRLPVRVLYALAEVLQVSVRELIDEDAEDHGCG
jgi:transcriptional regulator with XRE-family HTH domain